MKGAVNVLIVDASAEIRTRLAELLSALPGVGRVDAVDSAKDAHRVIQSKPPDIAVIGLHMPRGPAFQLLDALQSAPAPVTTIVLTNDPSPQWHRSCRQAGADFFFDKSVEFLRTIDVVAGLARGRASATAAAGPRADVDESLRATEQARKMEAIGRLAGGLAHDFNNLLTVIMGHSQEIIERLPPDDPSRADAVQVLNAGVFAAGLTRQLLAFSRRQILAPRVLDLNVVVEMLMPMLRRLIGEDVKLEIRLGAERYAVKADAGQLEQVIINLIVNARDAMPHGGTLTIETTSTLIEPQAVVDRDFMAVGRYVLLVVRDTGHGMDGETKAHLFEPFFTTKESGRGTGLGLSTVYGIVKQNEGYVFVDSEPEAGTTFRVYFPRQSADAITSLPGPRVPRKATGGSERILVVDDDLGVRHFAARVLWSRGYAVLPASSPGEAIEIAEREGTIHLLLTDLVMPGSTGRALATTLRGFSPGLKVLYMSGYTTEAIVDQGGLESSVAFIGKPFTAQHLAQKVRETLDQARPGAERL
jgi:signal transduction histidine kinase